MIAKIYSHCYEIYDTIIIYLGVWYMHRRMCANNFRVK